MKPSGNSPMLVDVDTCVRSNTGSAAFSGALLMFFGFFWFGGPTGSGAFLAGDTILHWTLRAGGLLMIAVAGWCSIGVPIALLVDAMLSILIGLLLGLSAVLMTAGEGLSISCPAYVVCGAIFITYGVRDLKIYRTFPPEEGEGKPDDVGTSFCDSVEERGFTSNLPAMGERAQEKRRSPGSTGVAGSEGFLSGFADEKKRAER